MSRAPRAAVRVGVVPLFGAAAPAPSAARRQGVLAGQAIGRGDGHRARAVRPRVARRAVRARRVAPERDCLGISLLSRGSTADGASQVLPSIGIIHGIQGEVAAEVGCAFWSTYEAVGGDAGILEWRRRSRLGADMSHPTRAGYEHLGRMLYLAFLEGFVDYLDRRVAGHVPG